MKKAKLNKEIIIEKMIELAHILKYDYININYLKKAMYSVKLNKKSDDGKNHKEYSNDAMATPGDALIKFVLSDYLYSFDFEKDEITNIKGEIESNESFVNIRDNVLAIKNYAYNDYNFYPSNRYNMQVSMPKHDSYIEAIVYAIYRDRGYRYTKKWIIDFLKANTKLDDLIYNQKAKDLGNV